MEVRDFTIDDQDSVYATALESWKVAYSQRYTANQIEEIVKDWYSKENHLGMISHIKNGSLFFKVLVDHNSIIGFILGDINKAQLSRLYIDPNHFHKGYGKLLLEIFNEELLKQKHTYMTVCCDKLNQIGLAFYKKQNFIIISEDEEEYLLKKQILEKQ
jgi:ribosomal protein S18 acetylase RimI-like enzyme